jgi:hypothetical protein
MIGACASPRQYVKKGGCVNVLIYPQGKNQIGFPIIDMAHAGG